jgi:hypothetical protein
MKTPTSFNIISNFSKEENHGLGQRKEKKL